MTTQARIPLIAGLTGLAIGLACALPAELAPLPAGGNAARTAAFQTVVAAMTAAVPDVTVTPLWAATLPPPYTPTQSPPPTTPAASATAENLPCNRASYVGDGTIPDGSVLKPEQDFTKTWRLRNDGSCTWTSRYSLVFDSGDRMSGAKTKALQGDTRPGETIVVAIDLEAPENRGDYKGYWKLRSGDGAEFGIGEQGTQPIWVSIRVSGPQKTVYSFVEDYCDADWSTASGDLPCPGVAGAPEGFVVRLEEPLLEGDRQEDEPGLWTQPQAVEDGRIRGEFPEFEVRKGDVFKALISCLDDSPACDVRMRLQYRIGDGSIETLAEWTEDADGEFRKVEVDLSDLAGEDVKFILSVQTRGDHTDDTAFWLMPRILR